MRVWYRWGHRPAALLATILWTFIAFPGASRALSKDPMIVTSAVRAAHPEHPETHVSAIRQGRFILTAGNAAVRETAWPATRIIAAPSAEVTPGFIDGHAHPNKGAIADGSTSVTKRPSPDEMMPDPVTGEPSGRREESAKISLHNLPNG